MTTSTTGSKVQSVIDRNRRAAAPAAAYSMMESMLLPGEHIVRVASISMGIYWKAIAVLFIAMAVMVLAFPLGVLLLAVSLFMLGMALLARRYLLLAATDKRIVIRSGIVFLDVVQLRYSKIESVEISWTLIGELLGYASVIITGTGNRVTIVPFVADALEFRRAINAILIARDDKIAETD